MTHERTWHNQSHRRKPKGKPERWLLPGTDEWLVTDGEYVRDISRRFCFMKWWHIDRAAKWLLRRNLIVTREEIPERELNYVHSADRVQA